MDDNFDHDPYAAIRSGIALPSALSRPSTLSAPGGMGFAAISNSLVGKVDVGELTASSSKPPPTGQSYNPLSASTSPKTAAPTTSKSLPTGQSYDRSDLSVSTSPNTGSRTTTQTNLDQAKQGIGTGAYTQQSRQDVTKDVLSDPVVGTKGGTSTPVIQILPTSGETGAPPPTDEPGTPPAEPDFVLVEAYTPGGRRWIELLLRTPSGCYSFRYRAPGPDPLPEDVLDSLDDQMAETMVRSLFSGDTTPFKVSELLGLLSQSGRARSLSGCELPAPVDGVIMPRRSPPLLPLLAIAGIGLLVMRYAE